MKNEWNNPEDMPELVLVWIKDEFDNAYVGWLDTNMGEWKYRFIEDSLELDPVDHNSEGQGYVLPNAMKEISGWKEMVSPEC